MGNTRTTIAYYKLSPNISRESRLVIKFVTHIVIMAIFNTLIYNVVGILFNLNKYKKTNYFNRLSQNQVGLLIAISFKRLLILFNTSGSV